MVRAFLTLGLLLGCGPLLAANFWISSSDDICPGQSATTCSHLAPPTSQVETVNHSPTDTQGTFYIWGKPDAGKNLGVWGLNVISSNSSAVSLSIASGAVEVFNPALGDVSGVPAFRWESVFEPLGTTSDDNGTEVRAIEYFGIRATSLRYHGFQSNPTGLGVGPLNNADPFYNSTENAWLLASVKYNIVGEDGDSASIFLQIAKSGMSQNGEDSFAMSAVLGLTSDAGLNANTQRGINSATADLVINISDGVPGDFNGDDKVNGRDFLLWQRNPAIGNLADWQTNYGSSQLSAVFAVPEPSAAVSFSLFALSTLLRRSRRDQAETHRS